MMVGSNLKDTQLQQIVDKTILFADKDEDGKIGFEEFCGVSRAERSRSWRRLQTTKTLSEMLQEPFVVAW